MFELRNDSAHTFFNLQNFNDKIIMIASTFYDYKTSYTFKYLSKIIF